MQAYDLSSLTVLIVEKQMQMRALLRQVLREFGVKEIHDAGDPDAAYQLFNEVTPDLVLCDWAPDFDGLGLVRTIRTDEASAAPGVPVIMVTAFNELGHVREALDAGMTEYLTKPVSARLLYQRLARVIENKRPFVQAGDFVGPDRRRRDVAHGGEERRHEDTQEARSGDGRDGNRKKAAPRADAA